MLPPPPVFSVLIAHAAVTRERMLVVPNPQAPAQPSTGFPESLEVRLSSPLTVALDASRKQGMVELAIPLSSFIPRLSFEQAQALVSIRRPDGRAVAFEVVGASWRAALALTLEGVNPSEWVAAPARFHLRASESPVQAVLTLSAPAIRIDTTAVEQQALRDQVFTAERALAEARRSLAEAVAVVEDPEHHIAAEAQARQRAVEAALQAVDAAVPRRRAEIRARLDSARPLMWALAADLPFADGSDTPLPIAGLAPPLLVSANRLAEGQDRVAVLRRIVANVDDDPALSPEVKHTATFELRDELAVLEPEVAALEVDVAQSIDLIRQRVAEAGLEEELWIRADFLLGNFPRSGAEGTFKHLLETQARLRAEVASGRDALERLTPGALELARHKVAELEGRVRAGVAQVSALLARLRQVEREGVVHDVPTGPLHRPPEPREL